jgi:hypothetical protein
VGWGLHTVTEESVYIIVPEDAPPEARKELEDLESQTLDDICLIIGIPFMLHKGLKYIPTIIAWAFKEGGSYGDDYLSPDGRVPKKRLRLMREIYNELASKVPVKIEEHAEGGRGAVWPCEVLDLKEVQEEAMLLAKSDEILIRMDDKKDYWMLFKRAIVHDSGSWKELSFKERIRKHMDVENKYLRAWGNFFLKALELHREYPNVRFWFKTETI